MKISEGTIKEEIIAAYYRIENLRFKYGFPEIEWRLVVPTPEWHSIIGAEFMKIGDKKIPILVNSNIPIIDNGDGTFETDIYFLPPPEEKPQ